MKVTFTQSLDAQVSVGARLSADGEFSAYVSAHCEYAPGDLEGATCSAQMPFPAELAAKVKDAFEKAIAEVNELLGRKLAESQHVAYKESVRLREISP
jgi:hypothetical protein